MKVKLTSLILALLLSQAYSNVVVTNLFNDATFTHEIKNGVLHGKLQWKSTDAKAQYFGIAFGVTDLSASGTDAIVCDNYAKSAPGIGWDAGVYDSEVRTGKTLYEDNSQSLMNIVDVTTETSFVDSGEYLVCTFTRKLITSDTDDKIIKAGHAMDIAYFHDYCIKLADWATVTTDSNIGTTVITFAKDQIFKLLGTGQKFEYEIIGYTLHGRLTWADGTSAPGDKKYLAIALGAANFQTENTDVIVCGSDSTGTLKVGAFDAKVSSVSKVIEIDTTNDVKIVDTGTSFATYALSCTFTRLLKTGDTGDQDIVDGENLVIAWGIGTNTNIKKWETITEIGTDTIQIKKASVVTVLATGKTFTHKVNDEKLIGVLEWTDNGAAEGSYLAIALKATNFDTAGTDVIVCGSKSSAAGVSDAQVGSPANNFAIDTSKEVD